MIMPGKHISMSESIFGLGGFVLSLLNTPKTLDKCWKELNKKYIDKNIIKKKHTLDTFILTIDFLYMIGSVDINERGEIYKCI